MSDLEARALEGFVEYDAETIVLTPYVTAKTVTGGYALTVGTPRTGQVCTVIPTTLRDRPVVAIDGKNRDIELHLVALELDVAVHDRFTRGGITFEVVNVVPDIMGGVRALAARHG